MTDAQPTRPDRCTGRSTDRRSNASRKPAGQRPTRGKSRHEGFVADNAPSLTTPFAPGLVGVSLASLPERPTRGAGARGLSEVLSKLSARDVAVLDLLAEHRFLTTHQLQAFCFYDHRTLSSAARSARRVLRRLCHEGLIARPARRVGGTYAGSEAHVWSLTGAGHRLRSIRAGTGNTARVRTPGARFIDHHLAVGDVRLQLVSAERAGRLTVSRLQIEPRCWQGFTSDGGGRQVLKPDLAATTTPAADREFEDHWYIEVDRATESIPTLIRQCRLYEECRRAGVVQHQRGVFPIVVWVVPTARRAENLQTAIHRTRQLDTSLYRICTPESLLPLIEGGAAS